MTLGSGAVPPLARPLTRRTFLGAVTATALLASGCRQQAAAPAVTVATLTRDRPFYLTYRGGAKDWPEMTAYGYAEAAKVPGLKALDVSVCQTSDGVLVCSYETNTLRLTGHNLTIGKEDWATLSTLTVTASQTNNVRQPRRPFTRLDDVLEAHLSNFVIFVEPQAKEAAGNLMAALIAANQPERIVWKQPVNSPRFSEAKRHGFSTLGYVLDEPAHTGANLSRYAAADEIDLLGVSRARKDAFIGTVARAARNQQKKLVGWDAQNAKQRARLLGLGCSGIASSSIKELIAVPLAASELPPEGR